MRSTGGYEPRVPPRLPRSSPVPRLVQRILLGLGALLALAAVAALVPMRTVAGDEMAWSLQPGDRIWVLPDRIRRADVVVLPDPLDPDRLVLRRAIAGAGQRVRIDEQGVRVNGKRIRQTEMGDQDGQRVLKEVIWSKPPARANPYLPIIADQPAGWKMDDTIEVPEGHWFLLADNRDGAVDSRWWGPVPESRIQGVVRLRQGPEDPWRSAWQVLLPEE